MIETAHGRQFEIGEIVQSPRPRLWKVVDRKLFAQKDFEEDQWFYSLQNVESNDAIPGRVFWRLLEPATAEAGLNT